MSKSDKKVKVISITIEIDEIMSLEDFKKYQKSEKKKYKKDVYFTTKNLFK
jgi:hypothetical protein